MYASGARLSCCTYLECQIRAKGACAYNKAEVHRKEYYGTKNLGAYVMSVLILNVLRRRVYCNSNHIMLAIACGARKLHNLNLFS